MDKCFSPFALVLGPSEGTFSFLVQFGTGLSFFLLNLCCRLRFKKIFCNDQEYLHDNDYSSAVAWLLTLKDLTKELPGGTCLWECSRSQAWHKDLQWKNHDKLQGFSPLAILQSALSTPSYPLVFPELGESCFPVPPALFSESASLRELSLALGKVAISVSSCFFLLMVSYLSASHLDFFPVY